MIKKLKIQTRAYSRSMEKRIANWAPQTHETSTFDEIKERDVELKEGYKKGLGLRARQRLGIK